MNALKTHLLVGLIAMSCVGCTGSPEQTETASADPSGVSNPGHLPAANKEVVEFLTAAAATRTMNITRGELAQKKGRTRALQEYGAVIIEDQARMLKDIRKLIAAKAIDPPEFIDLQFSEELEYLRRKNGRAFDIAFVERMSLELEREARELREAVEFSDVDVKMFALKYLPLIEKHQAQLATIRLDR